MNKRKRDHGSDDEIGMLGLQTLNLMKETKQQIQSKIIELQSIVSGLLKTFKTHFKNTSENFEAVSEKIINWKFGKETATIDDFVITVNYYYVLQMKIVEVEIKKDIGVGIEFDSSDSKIKLSGITEKPKPIELIINDLKTIRNNNKDIKCDAMNLFSMQEAYNIIKNEIKKNPMAIIYKSPNFDKIQIIKEKQVRALALKKMLS